MPHAFMTNKKQHLCPKALEKWMEWHPNLALILLFFAVPLFILGTVFLGTAVIMLPFSLIMGWM